MLQNEKVIFLTGGEPVYNPETSKNEYHYDEKILYMNVSTVDELTAMRKYGEQDRLLIYLRTVGVMPKFDKVAIRGEIYEPASKQALGSLGFGGPYKSVLLRSTGIVYG